MRTATVWLARRGIAIPIGGRIVHTFAVESGGVARGPEGINRVCCKVVDRFFVNIVREGDEAASCWTGGFDAVGENTLAMRVVALPVDRVDVIVCLYVNVFFSIPVMWVSCRH